MSTEQNNGKPAVPPKRNLLNDRRKIGRAHV